MNRIFKALNRPLLWTAGLALAIAAVLATLSIQRHANLESGEDLAMFDQMLWNVRNGNGLVTTLSGEKNLLFKHHFFGEHVAPILECHGDHGATGCRLAGAAPAWRGLYLPGR